MKIHLIFLFVIISLLGFAQSKIILPKITINPHVGLTWALPPKVELTSGNLKLKPNSIQNFFLGNTVTSKGENRYFFKISNNIGVDLNYSLNNTWQVNVGIDRFLLVNTLKDPDPIQISADSEYGKWFLANKFSSYSLGLSKYFQKSFIQAKVFYSSIPHNAVDDGKGVLINGNGLLRKNISEPIRTVLVATEIGLVGHNDFDFLNKMSLGVFLPLLTYAQDELDFIRTGKNVASNRLSFRQAGIIFKIETPITVWKGTSLKQRTAIKNKDITIKREMLLFEGVPVNRGDRFILKNIHFEQSQATLLSESIEELNRLLILLVNNPNLSIELIGHTSNEGDRNENKKLSLNRATVCKEYLIDKGIDEERIMAIGKGPDEPISITNPSLNRRVEVRFVKM